MPQISEEKHAVLVAKKKKRKERKERREELGRSPLRRRDAPKPLREELVRAVRRLGRKVERKKDETLEAAGGLEDEEEMGKWLEREERRKKEKERERKKVENWNRKMKWG
ncbi:hypothetical protein NA56DRAFT_665323 [Hyaloscypha hepaticicola]|uniref:Uncharacterized protein n=1 Tax=Hyaloscypha hepaticicola TaxID=2082293 RepID=A0A2J6PI52_9HELO|nr:hypothetical protein NA56DRAFT_665323 [Hyaloscypha hepaticicola]